MTNSQNANDSNTPRPVRWSALNAVSLHEVRSGCDIITAPAKREVRLQLRAHDLVVVKPASQILATLGPDGTLDGLPVMPEMLKLCGRRFRVHKRVVQAVVDGAFLRVHPGSFVREFRNNEVVTLEHVRCSGLDYDGCQRGCFIFWKEAWLEKVPPDEAKSDRIYRDYSEPQQQSTNLRTKTSNGLYFCQSAEFLNATLPLSGAARVRKCFSSVRAGNVSAFKMLKNILFWVYWKTRHRIFGEHVKGAQTTTPSECLSLQPDELVQIRSNSEIVATLNPSGRNRGLHFSGDQRRFCGGQYRVRSRADRFIAEGTGEMKQFKNTVILEDVICDSSYFAFGGCCRDDFLYWREAWLRRVNDENQAAHRIGDAVK